MNNLYMKLMNKINKTLSRNDSETVQLYEHGDVHVMPEWVHNRLAVPYDITSYEKGVD